MPTQEATREHWDSAYRRDSSKLSWYEPEPRTSQELIEQLGIGTEESIVDVGGGSSLLAARLIDHGFHDITVLDISTVALALAKNQLGARSEQVAWIAHDIRAWQPQRRFDLWHDRAAFHFLVTPEDQHRYVEVLKEALSPTGTAIIATFALDGPDRCSGLPVARYDAAALATLFAPELRPVQQRREERTTPDGTRQPFTWTIMSR